MDQVDARIPLQFVLPKIRNPAEVYQNSLALQNAQQSNEINALRMQEMQDAKVRSASEEAALRAYYTSQRDPAARNALAIASPKAYREQIKSELEEEARRAEIGQKQSAARKSDAETRIKQAERNAAMLRAAIDQPTWNVVRDTIVREAGPDAVAQIPVEFNPRLRDALLQATLTERDRLTVETTRRGQDMIDARTRSEGAANRAVTTRGQDMTDARMRDQNRITAAGSADPTATDQASMSGRYGVPVAPKAPWAGMSPKGAEKMRLDLYKQADKKLTDADDAVSAAKASAEDAKRFLELQSGLGKMEQGPVVGRAYAFSDAAQEMDAITAKITPTMRAPGSGATSDFDARMFQTATVGRTKNPATNEAIAIAIQGRAKLLADRAQFMRDYLSVNGHLDGADREWKRYVDANPIFDKTSPSVPKINKNMKTYQEFFGSDSSAPAAPASPGMPSADAIEAEIARRRGGR